MNIPEDLRETYRAVTNYEFVPCDFVPCSTIAALIERISKAEQALKDRDEVIISLTAQLERATNGEI